MNGPQVTPGAAHVGCKANEQSVQRELPVKGWLVRHQVRQHLDHNQIPYSEDRQAYGSTFTLDATDEQWGQIQDWVKKVTQ